MKNINIVEIEGISSLTTAELVQIEGGKSLSQWLNELMSGNATWWN